MKKSIKSIVTFGIMIFIISMFISNDSLAQGQGSKFGRGLNKTGVNFVDRNGDGICDNFVDANGDGINDNPKGFRGENGNATKPANGTGKFGSKSGVCDGTGKGRMGNQTNLNLKAK